MYTPKLSEELVRKMYRIASAKGVPMTKLLNDIVAEAIGNVQVEVKMVCEIAQETKEVYFIADNDSLKQVEV